MNTHNLGFCEEISTILSELSSNNFHILSSDTVLQVPKYLSERWKNADGKCEVGKLRITRSK